MASGRTRKDLDDDQVQAVYNYLLENTIQGKLRVGTIRDATVKLVSAGPLWVEFEPKRDIRKIIYQSHKHYKEVQRKSLQAQVKPLYSLQTRNRANC